MLDKNGCAEYNEDVVKEIYDEYRKHVVCYFPPTRHERPHWSNLAWRDSQNTISHNVRYHGIPPQIYVESSVDDLIQRH